jgi:hypothetical protein
MSSYRTRAVEPPEDTPQLLELRRGWMQQLHKPDWTANAAQCKAAYDVMRERRAA